MTLTVFKRPSKKSKKIQQNATYSKHKHMSAGKGYSTWPGGYFALLCESSLSCWTSTGALFHWLSVTGHCCGCVLRDIGWAVESVCVIDWLGCSEGHQIEHFTYPSHTIFFPKDGFCNLPFKKRPNNEHKPLQDSTFVFASGEVYTFCQEWQTSGSE